MPRLTNKPRKRADGRYECRVTVIRGGKRVRLSAFGKTAKQAEAKARDLKTRSERHMLPGKGATLAGFAESWLERKATEVSPRTVDLYRAELGYALPVLGGAQLAEIKPLDIRLLLDNLAKRLSIRTVRKVRERLHRLLEEALALELIYRNPVAAVKLARSKAVGQVGKSLEPGQVTLLLAALDTHSDKRTAMLLRLILACGLRKGEAMGLRWQDIDLEAGLLSIRQVWAAGPHGGRLTTPKTAGSKRTVPIPLATLKRLREYHTHWVELLGAAPRWVFPGDNPDKPLTPNSPNRALHRIVARLGIPHLRVHDLRHSYGSHLLANGAPLELVAERMGHANGNITLGIYRHLLQHERKGWVIDPEDLGQPRAKA
jgi:integrase